MSNHFHIVLYINSKIATDWTDAEVIARWHKLFKGSLQSQRFTTGQPQESAALKLLGNQVDLWRARLTDISWFMRILNEKVARKANKEDRCTGRFWEGHFECQALLDEQALMACMAYVDLNPVRAGIAKTPQQSDHTSVKVRCNAAKSEGRVTGVIAKQPKQLQRFVGDPRNDMPQGLPFRLIDYLELVDWTGRQIRDDKRGTIDEALPGILTRLELDDEQWRYLTQHFESSFKTLVSTMHSLRKVCAKLGYQRIPGKSACESLFQATG